MFGKQKVRRSYICSFCAKNQDEVQRLIGGPGGVFVCNECIARFSNGSAEEQSTIAAISIKSKTNSSRCSFCGKQEKQVQRLVEGNNGVNICDECIDLCLEIFHEETLHHS